MSRNQPESMEEAIEGGVKVKDQRITIRVSQEERERIERAADSDHRSISDWIRLTVLENLKEEKGGEDKCKLS